MKTKTLGLLKAIATISACLSIAATSQAAAVYDNVTTGLGSKHSLSGIEYGDQVNLDWTQAILDNPLEGRFMTAFQFEYYTELAPAANKTVTLRVYNNSGAAPGAELWNSGAIALENGNRSVSISNLRVPLDGLGSADSITWTVQFAGLEGAENAGLLLYNPPTVGSSFNDFWIKNGVNWELNQISGGNPVANFGARVVAVPEPGVVALVLLGGAALLGFRASRKNEA